MINEIKFELKAKAELLAFKKIEDMSERAKNEIQNEHGNIKIGEKIYGVSYEVKQIYEELLANYIKNLPNNCNNEKHTK